MDEYQSQDHLALPLSNQKTGLSQVPKPSSLYEIKENLKEISPGGNNSIY